MAPSVHSCTYWWSRFPGLYDCECPQDFKDAVAAGRFNFKREIFTIARRASGDCHFLDAKTRRCTVYEQRPEICRKHPQVGPRPNHCPYGAKRTAGTLPLDER